MLNIPFFRGARPKPEPHLLEQGEAQSATNTRLTSGGLSSFRGPTTIRATLIPNVITIAPFAETAFWFEFDVDANVVQGPVASDTESRTYFTGDGDPAMTLASIATAGGGPYPSNRYRLGIPAPDAAPTVAVTGAATGGEETADSRSYVFTYVSALGEEGAPSPATVVIDVLEGENAQLSNIPTAPTGNYNITNKRIYRTSTAAGDTSFLFVAEIPVANTSYTDTTAADSLGELLPSVDWDQPPAGMIGLIDAGNGVMAGFEDKDLFLSEPYLPHAWPYSITTNDPIVGLVAIRGGLVVATTGQPVIVGFAHPSALSQNTIETPRACVSKRSMVDMGDYALFATGDGLVAVDGSGNAPLITDAIMGRYDWQELNPETIHGYRKENWYIGFYQGNSGNGGFAITARGDQFFEFDFYADAGYSDPQTGDLYLVISDNIVRWDDDIGAPLTYVWRSGSVIAPKPVSLACGRVEAAAYPVTLRLYDESDNSLVYALSVTDSEPFWFPDNYLAREYSLELEGTALIKRVSLGEHIGEVM